ncbi:oligopeptide transporter 2 [Sarocladium strictum]
MADNNNISNEKPVAGDTQVSRPTAIDEVEPVPVTRTQTDPVTGEKTTITPEMQQKIAALYGKKAEEDDIAPSRDVQYIVDKIQGMSEEEAIQILTDTVEYHNNDPNFPQPTMEKIRLLLQGPKIYLTAGGDANDSRDYDFDLRTEAAIIHYHSPYPEVRSVTAPGDDPSAPCETFRAYFLGLLLMSGATAVNTFFSPRQPSISLSATVLQLLIAPAGWFMARVLPDWGFSIRGTRVSMNPGPWNYKEQVLTTIIFSMSSSPAGTYYVYLVQQLPQYLGHKWVTFAYEIVLALATQLFGVGIAGLLRRFVVYPSTAIFPKVFPSLALNRALTLPEKKGEVINGWSLSRYRFFLYAFGIMFVYFWIPNYLFKALRSFNWMTWIAPENFTLAMITGFWGGMGFNPWATFDYNVAGVDNFLVTPWFSTIQQYGARVLSGLIIIGMYWGNMYWSAYMPINSNEAFANDGLRYNVTRVLNEKQNGINLEAYKEYGPPFFSGANVFGQGAWFAWYPMTLFGVTISYWDALKKSAVDMWTGLRHRKSIYECYKDPFTRDIAKYREVPDWWFLVILGAAFALGVVALEVWPVSTPWWALLCVIAISAVMLIPATLLMASANVTMGFNVLFQLLAGVWFVGNPEALIIVTAFGQNFDAQAMDYISGQKMGHYAKVPPRAVFRGQVIGVIINCFIFVGMLDWMVQSYDDGTLCTWANKQHFVCTNAVLVFTSSILYGAFGVKNMFALYPILPYCFIIGSFIGITFGLSRRYGSSIKDYFRRKSSEARFATLNKWCFSPLSHLHWFDPAICWSGALNWTGGNNLSYATNGVYLAFIFMYYIKRHYLAWWEKYNYLLEAGFGVGIAISGIVQTFALDFTGVGGNLNWWGISVTTAGVDFRAYNQNATLYPIPDSGYFGPSPDQYPMNFS